MKMFEKTGLDQQGLSDRCLICFASFFSLSSSSSTTYDTANACMQVHARLGNIRILKHTCASMCLNWSIVHKFCLHYWMGHDEDFHEGYIVPGCSYVRTYVLTASSIFIASSAELLVFQTFLFLLFCKCVCLVTKYSVNTSSFFLSSPSCEQPQQVWIPFTEFLSTTFFSARCSCRGTTMHFPGKKTPPKKSSGSKRKIK